MKAISKLTKYGNSLYILVPITIRKLLKLKEKDIVEFNITKINPEKNTK